MKKKVKSATRFEKILENIREIKIQGAENVARAGIKAFLLEPSKRSAKKILATRPTEPLMQNAIKLLLRSKDPKETAKKFTTDLKKAHDSISKKGARLIKNNMNVYTHCHSSTVIDILKYAKQKQKKKFVVYTTEVEPILQGRLTAEDLAKSKIKVIIAPDLAYKRMLKKCDLLLFGIDAITKRFVANKIGTHTLTEAAKANNIPRYACGVSKKFTHKVIMEQRPTREVWDKRNKKIEVINPAFDKTPMKLLTGVISEFGVLKPREFIKRAKRP